MGTVMIRCPATGMPVATGLIARASDFARTPVFMARSSCPFCRTEHEWFAGEAWVEEPGALHAREPARARSEAA